MKKIVVALAILFSTATVFAQVGPTPTYGLQLKNNNPGLSPAGSSVFRFLTAVGHTEVSENGGAFAALGGGVNGLLGAYQGASAASQNILTQTAALGPLILRDNAAPIGTQLAVQSSGGATSYFTAGPGGVGGNTYTSIGAVALNFVTTVPTNGTRAGFVFNDTNGTADRMAVWQVASIDQVSLTNRGTNTSSSFDGPNIMALYNSSTTGFQASGGTANIMISAAPYVVVNNTTATISDAFVLNPVGSTGSPPSLIVLTPATHTLLTTTVEYNNLVYTGVSQQFSAGTIALQRDRLYNGTTYVGSSAMTITDAYAEYAKAPVAGASMTITRDHVYGANIDSVGTLTTRSGFTAINTTTSADTTHPQFSPTVDILGTVVETTGSTSQTTGWHLQAQGSNPAVPTAISNLVFLSNTNGVQSTAALMKLRAANAVTVFNADLTSQLDLDHNDARLSGSSLSDYLGIDYNFTHSVELNANNSFVILVPNKWYPNTDNSVTQGDSTHRWKGLFNSANLSAGHNAQSGTTYTVLITDWFVGLSNVAARTITLYAANAVNAGTQIVLKDTAGTGATANITVNRAGGDTIDGGTSATIITNYGDLILESNGVSAWSKIGGL